MTPGEGRIVQISVSPRGVPKLPVPSARITVLGVEGDGHRAVASHGGPERAVCLYAMEAILALQAEGHPIVPGTLGENVTIEGLAWDEVAPGRRLLLGDGVLLEVTSYTTPCRTIMRAFSDRAYGRISQARRPGWSRVYTRVLAEGVIAAGAAVRVLDTAQAAEDVARSIYMGTSTGPQAPRRSAAPRQGRDAPRYPDR
jgi:MOSC domain-containing protein YiiM